MFPLTPAYKAIVQHGGVRFHTHVSATDEVSAIRKLQSEGFRVLDIQQVYLTHLGGEVTPADAGHPDNVIL